MQLSESKYFLSRLAKLAPKPSRHETHFDLSHPSVRSRVLSRGVCQTNKMSRKEGWNELDSEKVKIKRESGIWRYNDYSESFSVLITQSSRFRNKKTKTEGFRKKWRQKRENNWEWNFLTGKLLKNYQNFNLLNWRRLIGPNWA